MNPSIRQLEAFVHVYHLGSVTRAADRMHITQSAVSVLIRQLESNFRTKLFDRTTRALYPTEAAKEVLATAERVLRDLDNLNKNVRGLSDKTRGRVSLAVSAGVASAVLPSILKTFVARHPGVELAIHDIGPDQLTGKILSEEAEFGIGTDDARSPELVLETLVSDRLSVICIKDRDTAARKQMGWNEIGDLPTITVRKGLGIRTLIDDTLATRKKIFKPTFEVSLLTTALSMTAQGLGVSILPAFLVPHMRYQNLIAIPLVNPVVRRDLSVITRAGRSLSPAAESFIAIARQILAHNTERAA
jgi:DNA-binding transcriptional LysR family regulator